MCRGERSMHWTNSPFYTIFPPQWRFFLANFSTFFALLRLMNMEETASICIKIHEDFQKQRVNFKWDVCHGPSRSLLKLGTAWFQTLAHSVVEEVLSLCLQAAFMTTQNLNKFWIAKEKTVVERVQQCGCLPLLYVNQINCRISQLNDVFSYQAVHSLLNDKLPEVKPHHVWGESSLAGRFRQFL